MNKKFKCLLFSSLCFFANTTVFAGVYTYEVRSIDSDLGMEACNSMISSAAAKFETDTGVNLISSGCEADTILRQLTGKIIYSAAKRISPWSTMNTTYGEEIELFRNRQQCEEGLQREIELFQRMSSLTPFISFCHKISEIGPPRYRTRIDAVGDTTIRRYESVAVINHPFHNIGSVVSTLQEQSLTIGLTPVAWYNGPVRSQQGLAVAYYAERSESPYRLLAKNLLYFSSLTDCEAAAVSFEQTRTTAWTGISTCSVGHSTTGFQLNLIWWDRAIGADLVLRSTPIPGSHASLTACRSSASQLAAELAQDGEKIVGVVCGRDSNPDSPIKMELISLDATRIR